MAARIPPLSGRMRPIVRTGCFWSCRNRCSALPVSSRNGRIPRKKTRLTGRILRLLKPDSSGCHWQTVGWKKPARSDRRSFPNRRMMNRSLSPAPSSLFASSAVRRWLTLLPSWTFRTAFLNRRQSALLRKALKRQSEWLLFLTYSFLSVRRLLGHFLFKERKFVASIIFW